MEIKDYKGFHIQVNRDKDGIVKSYIRRKSDNWLLEHAKYAEKINVREALEDCKWSVWDYIENPLEHAMYEEALEADNKEG